jgi:hypothetical protein
MGNGPARRRRGSAMADCAMGLAQMRLRLPGAMDNLLRSIERGSAGRTRTNNKKSQSECPNARELHPASILPIFDFLPVHSLNRAAHTVLIGSKWLYFRLACRFATANPNSARRALAGSATVRQAIAYFYNNRIHDKRSRRLRQTAYNFLVSCVYYIVTRRVSDSRPRLKVTLKI